MTFPLKRIAVGLSWLAVGILFVGATTVPSDADAQSASTKRAAPPAKSRTAAKPIAQNPSPWVPNPSVSGKTAYLIVDATSGREISSDQADELRHPASLTKLMTIYLTFSALDSGRLALGDSLPVSASALNAPPTKMGLPPGGSVSVRDAMMALVTRSANDAAVVLAEAIGGDEQNFARLMTQKARQIGMSSTVFRNASGLPNREQVTTARDLARFGIFLDQDGVHQGKRLLPEGWIQFVSTPAPARPVVAGEWGYGAQFWLLDTMPDVPKGTYTTFGNKGQYVTVVPGHDLVIVRTGVDPNGIEYKQDRLVVDVLKALKQIP